MMQLVVKQVSGIDFELNVGQALWIRGPNGCGKTTLLRSICGLRDVEEGEILWQGKNILADREAFLMNCVYLGHQNGIKAHLTVRENIELAIALQNNNQAILLELLDTFNLQNKLNTLCAHLSAGQQRKVALSKLLFTKASLWLLDEPLTSLDESSCKIVSELMINHVNNQGMLIFASHHPYDLSGLSVDTLELNLQPRRCEERSDEAIHLNINTGLLRCARNDGVDT